MSPMRTALQTFASNSMWSATCQLYSPSVRLCLTPRASNEKERVDFIRGAQRGEGEPYGPGHTVFTA